MREDPILNTPSRDVAGEEIERNGSNPGAGDVNPCLGVSRIIRLVIGHAEPDGVLEFMEQDQPFLVAAEIGEPEWGAGKDVTFAVKLKFIHQDGINLLACRFNRIWDREIVDRRPGLEMVQQGVSGQVLEGFRKEMPGVHLFTRRVLTSGKPHGFPGDQWWSQQFPYEKG